MNRLTYRSEGICHANFGTSNYDIISRLADYEDTGITPEDFAVLKSLAEKSMTRDQMFSEYMEFKRFKQEKTEGRISNLPCRVGDILYAVTRDRVSVFRVDHFEIYTTGIWVSWSLVEGILGGFRIDGTPAGDIGKTVFLNREDAEDALRRSNG